MLDLPAIRADFPALHSDQIYFDSACMSLKPRPVLQALQAYYQNYSGCHGRSSHHFSRKTTQKFEEARAKLARFIGADAKEVVFTRNTTEGIALLAYQFLLQGRRFVDQGNPKPVVIISNKEHNSNLVPWLRLKHWGLIKLLSVSTNNEGRLDLAQLEKLLKQNHADRSNSSRDSFLVSLNYVSNLDGVINPVQEIVLLAHQHGYRVHLDAAQAAPHLPINVRRLPVDFLTFSGHKMLGPTGTGVFYARKELLEELEPMAPGGGSVVSTTREEYRFLTAPEKFEGGLQNYAGSIGLGAAADYLSQIGLERIHHHEIKLNQYLRRELAQFSRVRLLGSNTPSSGVTSFVVEGMDSHQVALLLDKIGQIMVRSGQFCVHAWFNEHAIKSALRVSLYLYNTPTEVEKFVVTLRSILEL